MLAGTAEIVITPPPGAPLLGTIQRSDGVHDDLYARTLILDDGAARIAIVCLDLVGMDFVWADTIRSAIRARTGIKTSLLNCSHTHSAPFTIPWSVLGFRWCPDLGKVWRDQLVDRIAEAVFRAGEEAEDAVLRVGRAPVRIGWNRRLSTDQGILMKPDPQGVVVPWVDVLRVDRRDGNPAAILFSHAAHPVVIHGSSRKISADYPGYAVASLKSRFGPETMTMFGQACGANINADPLRGGFTAAQHAGTLLAEAAFQAARDSRVVSPLNFDVTSMTMELPLAPLPTVQECSLALREAEDRLAQCSNGVELDDGQLWEIQDRIGNAAAQGESLAAADVQPMQNQPWWLKDTVLCLRDLVSKVESGDEQPLRFEAQLLRIGDQWSLLAVTHEVFAEHQLWFDAASPTELNMMLAYTNGCESYIPPDIDLSLGGYEAATFPSLDGAALRYRHRRSIRRGSEQQFLEGLRRLWA